MLLDKTHTETGLRRTNKITLIFPPHSLRISFPGVLVISLQAACWNHTTISIWRYTEFCLRELNWNMQAGLSLQSTQLKGKQNEVNYIFFSYPQISLYFSKQKRVVYFYRYLFYTKFSTNETKMTLKNIKQSHVLQMEFSVLSSLKSEYFSLSLFQHDKIFLLIWYLDQNGRVPRYDYQKK